MVRHIGRLIVPGIFLLMLGSCGSEQEPSKEENVTAAHALSVSDMHWLTGTWQHVTPGGIVFEQWERYGNTMKGRGGFIAGTDTAVSENIVLEMQGSDLMYIPTVKEQNGGMPVPFRLTVAVGDSFVFENPAHDFPTRITYRRLSDTSLEASISGTVNGVETRESFGLTLLAH